MSDDCNIQGYMTNATCQRCANCDYYAANYFECEHPDQTQSMAEHKTPDDGADCELWAYGGEPEEAQDD